MLRGRGVLSVFQFQTGAIKSQFKDSDKYPIIMFQFQTGAIKSQRENEMMLFDPRFNSKLVRLKGRDFFEVMMSSFAFQFQTGAIKSSAPNGEYQAWFVSIPNWCD